jgi:hypothetical protein
VTAPQSTRVAPYYEVFELWNYCLIYILHSAVIGYVLSHHTSSILFPLLLSNSHTNSLSLSTHTHTFYFVLSSFFSSFNIWFEVKAIPELPCGSSIIIAVQCQQVGESIEWKTCYAVFFLVSAVPACLNTAVFVVMLFAVTEKHRGGFTFPFSGNIKDNPTTQCCW